MDRERKEKKKKIVRPRKRSRLTREQKELLRKLDDSLESKSSPKRNKFFDTIKEFFD